MYSYLVFEHAKKTDMIVNKKNLLNVIVLYNRITFTIYNKLIN